MIIEKFEFLRESIMFRKKIMANAFKEPGSAGANETTVFNITEDILQEIIKEKPVKTIVEKIIKLAKNYISFEGYAVYEWTKGNKLKLVHTNIQYKALLKFKERQLFANKKELLKNNDVFPNEDEDTLYHPVVVGKELRYVIIFDSVNREEHEKHIRSYTTFCKEMQTVFGCLLNRTLSMRSRYIDQLTGFSNELQLRKDIQYCMSSEKDYILAIIEIDNMKAYNKNFGVWCGDAAIKHIIEIADGHAGREDGVYRYHGAKVAMLLCGNHEKHFSTLSSVKADIQENVLDPHKEKISMVCTIGAVELQYVEQRQVDIVYQKALRALNIEKGSICFSGERREVEYDECVETKNKKKAEEGEKESTSTENNKDNEVLQHELPTDENDCEVTAEHPESVETKNMSTDQNTEVMEEEDFYEYDDAEVMVIAGEEEPFYVEEEYTEIDDIETEKYSCENDEKQEIIQPDKEAVVANFSIGPIDFVNASRKTEEETNKDDDNSVNHTFEPGKMENHALQDRMKKVTKKVRKKDTKKTEVQDNGTEFTSRCLVEMFS